MSCLILDVTDRDTWPQIHATGEGPQRIPEVRRPTVLQLDRETAEKEALRLAQEHPGRRFVVFQAMAAGTTVEVPTHMTLGVKVVACRHQPTIVQLGPEARDEEDDLPF